jgi:transcriptional regulator with XRE-family HTH domain
MTTTRIEPMARRNAAQVHGRLADDLGRLCADAGVSQRQLALAAGVGPSYLSRILCGLARPSVETYAALAAALGADLAARLYPTTGPTIRDRHQAPILEGLLAQIHPRWHPFTEVAVRKPARGWIDVALHEPRERLLIATEIESEINRLEQQVRWSGEKAESLPSWTGWSALDDPTISRLLMVRWTRATRQVAREFPRQLAAAYPAHPADAIAALAGTSPWPGPALLWVRLDHGNLRLVGER